jgi:hypothetical protein
MNGQYDALSQWLKIRSSYQDTTANIDHDKVLKNILQYQVTIPLER